MTRTHIIPSIILGLACLATTAAFYPHPRRHTAPRPPLAQPSARRNTLLHEGRRGAWGNPPPTEIGGNLFGASPGDDGAILLSVSLAVQGPAGAASATEESVRQYLRGFPYPAKLPVQPMRCLPSEGENA
eukprot:CAMPEP_0113323386 /NCGR_PEP_ID=MMETSP0010_2-20120614/16274_1 /TAXON_ID=216773 ORGANISM="Corethron hystrix, Strain 308" /NCGR_SAMPLE_ID=MMETSP0010_2 /ASSEMBLY_ACC=CAM_ASM_000155 /LENGTH=129 /DNA_ID=CAMNT_0000182275 /DNA_START=136 /DNA_END=522 /DNA_ORIENTATION=- /assembly_acc=CAM_ASM_000155